MSCCRFCLGDARGVNNRKDTAVRQMWKNDEPWDKGVPPDLIPAIKHLRESFYQAHFTFGHVTKILCYSQLHNGIEKAGFGESKEYIKTLVQLKSRIGPVATQRFHDLLTQRTLR